LQPFGLGEKSDTHNKSARGKKKKEQEPGSVLQGKKRAGTKKEALVLQRKEGETAVEGEIRTRPDDSNLGLGKGNAKGRKGRCSEGKKPSGAPRKLPKRKENERGRSTARKEFRPESGGKKTGKGKNRKWVAPRTPSSSRTGMESRREPLGDLTEQKKGRSGKGGFGL